MYLQPLKALCTKAFRGFDAKLQVNPIPVPTVGYTLYAVRSTATPSTLYAVQLPIYISTTTT